MRTLNIALLQMLSSGPDQDANRAKGEQFCRRAREMGADIALFPEMWSNGYTIPERNRPEEVPHWQRQAIERDSDFVTHFRELARELDMAIALTYLEKWPSVAAQFALPDRPAR